MHQDQYGFESLLANSRHLIFYFTLYKTCRLVITHDQFSAHVQMCRTRIDILEEVKLNLQYTAILEIIWLLISKIEIRLYTAFTKKKNITTEFMFLLSMQQSLPVGHYDQKVSKTILKYSIKLNSSSIKTIRFSWNFFQR